MSIRIAVQTEDFDVSALQAELADGRTSIGGIASFVGLVRSEVEHPVTCLELEHYPPVPLAAGSALRRPGSRIDHAGTAGDCPGEPVGFRSGIGYRDGYGPFQGEPQPLPPRLPVRP